MDTLVVVGNVEVPAWLRVRANHVVPIARPEVTPEVVSRLRASIPRAVGVVGGGPEGAKVADQLHRAGFPVTWYTDEPGSADSGVEVRALTDRGPAMEVAGSILDLVGNTPMVHLDRIGRDVPPQVVAKLEYLNPGGSVKDRPAVAMIDAAEAAGLIGPGGTIVEPTSGNTGLGLAIVAARRGYRCVFTMPDKIAEEKVNLLRAFGAEVVVCPTTVAPDHPDSYYSVAKAMVESIPGAYQPDQYHNPVNPASHEASTGPEIWRQTAGRVTHFVASIGTGGTISGVARYLKRCKPSVQIIGADPEGSVYSGGSGRPYLVEGIGEDFWPTTYEPGLVDRVVMVSDRDSFLTARRITREEGILAGGSSGTAVWAALEVAAELSPDDVVVVLLPDSGRGYLSKIYNDRWMADHGFLRAGGEMVAGIMTTKNRDLPPLVHVHPEETVRSAIAVLNEYGVSQMPVIKAEPPLSLAEVVGSVSDRQLLARAFADGAVLDEPVGSVMDPPLPTIGIGETADLAAGLLQGSPAIVVLDGGHPIGILTRSDVLEFVARAQVPEG